MNQEAIDQIKAERDSAWDLMGKAMDERDHFLKQRDALAAENKVLREALNESVKALSAGPDGRRLYPESRLKALTLIAALTKEATNVTE